MVNEIKDLVVAGTFIHILKTKKAQDCGTSLATQNTSANHIFTTLPFVNPNSQMYCSAMTSETKLNDLHELAEI